MSVQVIVNGVGYNYPVAGDSNWAENATNWAVAVSQNLTTINAALANVTAGTSLLANGSAAIPSLRFVTSPTTGLFRFATDSLGFTAAGVAAGSISADTTWNLGLQGGALTQKVWGQLNVVSSSTGKVLVQSSTDNTDAITASVLSSTSTSGQAYFAAIQNAGFKWSMGLDLANSGQFVIANQDGVTGSRMLTIQPSTGAALFTGPVTVGTASSAPSSPINGESYYDSTLKKIRVYQNGYWINTDRNIISVRDFGATGNGTTDDTAAIQAAIDYANTQAIVSDPAVYVPQGRYLISNITMPGGMCIYGEGCDMSIFFGKAGSTGYMLTDQGNAAHIELHRLGFYANSQDYDSIIRLGWGLQLGSDGTIISDIVFRDAPNGVGLDINGNVAIFRNCTGGNVDIGIRAFGSANSFDQCSVAGYTTYGIIAGDSFWTQTELEAPNLSTSIPFYFLRQVKVFGIIMSLSEVATNFDNLFFADAGASNCTIDGLILYPSASTYTNLVGGDTAAVTFTTSTAGVPVVNTIPVYSQVNREVPIALTSSPLTIAGSSLSGITSITGLSTISGLTTFNPSVSRIDLSANSSNDSVFSVSPALNRSAIIYTSLNASSTSGASYFASIQNSGTKWSAGFDLVNTSSSWAIANTDGFATASKIFVQVSTAGAITLGAASGTQTHAINTATAISATAGTNGAVPSQVSGYISISINGSTKKIPYFNV